MFYAEDLREKVGRYFFLRSLFTSLLLTQIVFCPVLVNTLKMNVWIYMSYFLQQITNDTFT